MGEGRARDEQRERAKRYRHHAEELRTMSQDWRDSGTVDMVRDLARGYDKMAAELEKSVGPDGSGQ